MKDGVFVPSRGRHLVSFEETPGAWFCGASGTPPPLEEALGRTAAVERAHGVKIHLLDAGAVCGAAHLASALLHARRAKERGRAHAREPKVELMLYLTGNRQIARAIEAAGIGPETLGVAIAIEGAAQEAYDAHVEVLHALELSRDDSVIEPSAKKAKALGVSGTAKDEAGWEALAIEKVAVLDLD
jgi:KEOPS complex subunit Cgi121